MDPEEDIPYTLEQARIAKSTANISPGDFLLFKYPLYPYDTQAPLEERFVIVVSSDRTTQGLFVSTRKNILLICFKLPFWNEQTMSAIIDRLHKNRRRCNYYTIKQGLQALLGIKSCRTYDTKKIQHLNEISVIRKKGFLERLMHWFDWF